MTSTIGTFVHSIFDWANAADYRYREACKMMDLDDHVLEDIGLTRAELLDELGIDRMHGTSSRPLGRRETNYWSGLANSRLARGEL
jgi:uncharacterized protein YjiS (DUF1127 family)